MCVMLPLITRPGGIASSSSVLFNDLYMCPINNSTCSRTPQRISGMLIECCTMGIDHIPSDPHYYMHINATLTQVQNRCHTCYFRSSPIKIVPLKRSLHIGSLVPQIYESRLRVWSSPCMIPFLNASDRYVWEQKTHTSPLSCSVTKDHNDIPSRAVAAHSG